MSEAMPGAMAAAWRALEALPRPKLTDLFAGDSGRLAKLTARGRGQYQRAPRR
jgi:hypothetical protein